MNYITQLSSILKASGWSQEQLARELGVSFPTLNSWLNSRSVPRRKALQKIGALYLDVVGSETVNDRELATAKSSATGLIINPKALVDTQNALDKLTLYLTYHTNTIEGSTMTLSDVKEVIFEDKVLANRTAVEQAEARNHQAALYWLLDKVVADGKRLVIDDELILGIHLRLMNGIIGDAGQYRKHGARIMGSRVPLANWQKIPELVAELCGSLKHTPKDIVTELAYTHASFEKIHPFSDGNGRTGRLVMLAQALRAGLVPPLVVKEKRYAYYKYLEIAQTQDNHEPLELFVARSMEFCHDLLDME
jgi:Fic family protein/lambda repressor-like predicted transcriptional regulator